MRQSPLSKAEYVWTELINGQWKLLKVVESTSQLTGMQQTKDEPNLDVKIHNARKALDLIDTGADWSILSSTKAWSCKKQMQLDGTNDMTIGKPSFAKMTCFMLAYPLYVVQYIELAYVAYQGGYSYAVLLLVITVVSACTAVTAQFKKQMALFKVITKQLLVPIVRNGVVRAFASHSLVPGDVLVLLRGKASCDMVLLRGSCLVEESMLSGEAAQARKSRYVPENGREVWRYHPDTHHSCTIHAGTFVQQVWNEEDPEDEVLALVVRTGFNSTMGNMLRQIVCPIDSVKWKQDPFLLDYLWFCSFALGLQLCVLMLFLSSIRWHHPSNAYIAKRLLDMLIAAAPTGVPTVTTFALGRCMRQLGRRRIDVLRPEKIKNLADVQVVCLDKTGTLTGSVPNLHGVVLVEEQEIFNAVEAHFVDRNQVALPLQTGPQKAYGTAHLHILKRFEFEELLLRGFKSLSRIVTLTAPAPACTFRRCLVELLMTL
ncbi:hypothetical protein WJX79_004043 [Trebouxia sp. C0005]